MLTREEVEMLASLLTRAGVNAYEAAWANGVMDKLRVLAGPADAQKKQEKDTQAPAEPPAE